MASQNSDRRNSNTQLLEELETLSRSLYQSHTSANRRTTSLALPRTSITSIPAPDDVVPAGKFEDKPGPRQRLRRMSLSPWRSRPQLDDDGGQHKDQARVSTEREVKKLDDKSGSVDKKGIWSWKPIRALSHIGMQKLSCLFSVEVVTAQGLPASMNGLRLSVCVRKKETKEGAVQTMPSRVSQGAADFEETLFVKCHVYCTPGNAKQLKFEPRPFWIYMFAIDAGELDFGRSSVDLSQLIQESVEKNYQGTRVRQWDTSFNLSGKAKGGELVLKLGFQIMEKDGGIGIYSQAEGSKVEKSKNFSSAFGRKQSKMSFSIPSPRLQSRSEAWTPSQVGKIAEIQGMDDLNLDEPAPAPSTSSSVQKSEEPEIPSLQLEGVEDASESEPKVYLPDLGKGLGCVVQTRNGGYLAATNPFDVAVARKDTPKLAMQMSKPLVLESQNSASGFEIFQRMAAMSTDELSSQLMSLMPMDELIGKTAEQIAFEGIASAIIQGRNKEVATSSAARTIAWKRSWPSLCKRSKP